MVALMKRILPYLCILSISAKTFAQQPVGAEVRAAPNLTAQFSKYFHNDQYVTNQKDAALFNRSSKLFKTINLKLTNVRVKVILDTLKNIFQYSFFIETAVSQIRKKISIDARNATLLDILNIVAQKVPNLQYGFQGQFLIVRVKSKIAASIFSIDSMTGADSIKVLEEVYVKYYTNGHQDIPQKVATGSFVATDIDKFQTVNSSPNVIERIQGISVPILLDHSDPITGPKPFSIRGINTIYGNDKAITVLNGFRVFNSTNFINPFDISKITFLRDATAATLFGTTSANGAIVLNTEEGLKNDFEVNALSRITFELMPDLSYGQGWGAAQMINFNKAVYYNYGNSSLPYNSPIRNILDQVANNSLNENDALDTFSRWEKNNFRKDIQNATMRNSWRQQYALNIRTGSSKTKFYASGGIDNNEMPEKGNKWSRQTLTTNTTYTDSIFMVQVNASLANIGAGNKYVPVSTALPYWSLYNEKGDPQHMPYGYNPDLQNSIGQTNLLPWSFNPSNEQGLSDNSTKQQYHSFGGKAGIKLFKGFQASFSFLLEQASYNNEINYVPGTYYANDLINKFRSVDSSGKVNWVIPIGSIRDQYKADAKTSQWRTEFEYTKQSNLFNFVSLGGFEKINHEIKMSAIREYGADIRYPQSEIDYRTEFPISISPGKKLRIPYLNQKKDSADHFFNFYASSHVTYNKKYIISGIVRTDLSNRFSEKINQFGIGVWSVAGSWNISDESFYKSNFLSHLKWRSSYGMSGNINYTILPFEVFESVNNQGIILKTHRPQAQSLTYEKLYIFNTGLDFEIKKGLISGNVDYFRKKGIRLLNYIDWNPTTGNHILLDNSGSVKGAGVDINLVTSDIKLSPGLQYNVALNYSYAKTRVTTDPFKSVTKRARDYTDPYTYMPRSGYPVESIFAFRSAGLNPANGNPRGYLNGVPSEDYNAILNSTDGSTVDYVGPAMPTSMANIFHQIKYRSLSLTWILAGKFGYYYRMEPMDFRRVLLQQDDGIPGKVWQNPGDEMHTDLPSFQYPFNHNREDFANGRTTYVIKADHIKLQTIQITYQFNNYQLSSLNLKRLQLSFAINNIGMIYKANKYGIDPDVPVNGYKIPTSFNFTLISTY